MSRKHNTVSIVGSKVENSAIGIGHVEQHGARTQTGSTPEQLRALLGTHATDLVGAGRDDDERAGIRHDLKEIDKLLGGVRPDPVAVRLRWASVRDTVDRPDTPEAVADAVATIGENVRATFGA
jgi:hypothetical protein